MKVLITTDLYTTETNGVVTSVHNLIYELERRGHDVRVITFSKNRKSHAENGVCYIKSISIGFIYPDVRMPFSRAHEYIEDIVNWAPDVIHSQCEFFSYDFARKVSRECGAPIVHTYHTLYEDYVGYITPFKRLGRWVVRHLITKWRLKQVATIIAPTEKVRSNLINNCKVSNPIAVIPSGICLDKHLERIGNKRRAELRRCYGLDEGNFVLLNLGRLANEKNVDELISFYKEIYKKHENARLLIVGGGPAEEVLRAFAAAEGVSEAVIFTGMVKPDTVAEYYQMGDVFVCASTSETQGLTYIEAAANGLPMLCRNDPCVDGVIYDGENGYRYESFEEFSSYLDRMITDIEWRAAASARSTEIARAFDRAVFGASVEQVYEKVTTKSAKEQTKNT